MPKLTAPLRRKVERIQKLYREIAQLAFEVESQLGLEGAEDSEGVTVSGYLDAGQVVPDLLATVERFTPAESEEV